MSGDQPVPIFFLPSRLDSGEWRFTAAEQELLGLKPGDRLGTGIVGQPVEPTPPQPTYAKLLAEVEKLRGALETIRRHALKVNNAEYAPILTVAMCDILDVIERAGIEP